MLRTTWVRLTRRFAREAGIEPEFERRKMDISTALKGAGSILKRNSSTILTGLSVAGVLSTVVFGVKAGMETGAYLERRRIQYRDDDRPMPTRKEIVADVWKDYIPVEWLAVLTASCTIGAQSINLRRQAALVSAFTVSETALREYQEQVNKITPTKDQQVRDEIAKKDIEANPVTSREVIITSGKDQLFYEPITGRYFTSDMETVRKAVNDINFQITNQVYASQNDFYRKIGLPTVDLGDEFGWSDTGPLEVDYSAQLTDDGRSAIVLRYYREPIKDYWRVYK